MNPSSGSAAAARPFDEERPLEDERPPPPADGNSNEPTLTPGIDIIGGHPPELTLKVFTLAFDDGGGIDAPLGGGGGTYWAYFFGLLSFRAELAPPLSPPFLPKSPLNNPFFSFGYSYAYGFCTGALTSSTYSYFAGAEPCLTFGISKGGGQGPVEILNVFTFALVGGGGISVPPGG